MKSSLPVLNPQGSQNRYEMNEAARHYRADITAGALKLPETRVIADLLLVNIDLEGWNEAIGTKNVLQARNPATARRLTQLIRGRLEVMGPILGAYSRLVVQSCWFLKLSDWDFRLLSELSEKSRFNSIHTALVGDFRREAPW